MYLHGRIYSVKTCNSGQSNTTQVASHPSNGGRAGLTASGCMIFPRGQSKDKEKRFEHMETWHTGYSSEQYTSHLPIEFLEGSMTIRECARGGHAPTPHSTLASSLPCRCNTTLQLANIADRTLRICTSGSVVVVYSACMCYLCMCSHVAAKTGKCASVRVLYATENVGQVLDESSCSIIYTHLTHNYALLNIQARRTPTGLGPGYMHISSLHVTPSTLERRGERRRRKYA